MLRRATKRSQNRPTETGTKRLRQENSHVPLGDKSEKDEAEKVLEKVVLGGEEEILDNFESLSPSHEKKGKKKEAPQPAWEDDDIEGNVKISKKDYRHAYFPHNHDQQVSTEKYKQTLHNQFEKVAGTPAWARLRWERPESENDEDSDNEASELLQSTGNYLTASESLPKGTIQMKRCADANKDTPTGGKLKSVEFHPSAQVILTAGMDQRLNLFQVDGKNNPKIQSVFLDKCPIFCAHFTADGREVVVGSKHKSFFYYDMMEGKIVKVPKIKGLEESTMGRLVVSPDGQFLTFLGKYGNMHLISAKSKEWIGSMKMNGSVAAVAYNAEATKMFSHGDDGTVYIWDMKTRDCVHKFVDDGCIQGTSIAVSRNGQYIATGSQSGVVNIYSDSCLSETYPRPLKAMMNLTSPCTALSFNPATEILAASSDLTERALRLMHLPSLTVFSNFPDRADSIRIPFCQDFSVRGGYFTVGNHRGQALLYRVKHYSEY